MAMTKEKQARKRAKIRQNPIKHSAIKDKDKLRKAQARAASKASMSCQAVSGCSIVQLKMHK